MREIDALASRRAVLVSAAALSSMRLEVDEVLLEGDDGCARIVTLGDLVREDILATRASYLPVDTEAYYSVEHFLGMGGDDWTPEEERKLRRHGALRAELEAVYDDIGAFSLEEGLAAHFTAELVGRFAAGDEHERQRVLGWLRYLHRDAGQSVTHPGGFLRTRLEGGHWAPHGVKQDRRRL